MRRVLTTLAAVVVAALPAPAAAAQPAGPELLRAPAAQAPQLENTGIWRAEPILVSGASAYRDGEFVYQDFLYDDHGANTGRRDAADPRAGPYDSPGGLPGGDLFAPPNGTYTYPSDPVYANNAADLVEVRVRALDDATAFRLTFNTMKDPGRVATMLLLDGDEGSPVELPFGANVRAPAELVVLVDGERARLVKPDGSAAGGPPPAAAVDRERRQIEVRVPRAAWDPGSSAHRIAAATGLWDAQADRFLLPGRDRTATAPGGGGALADVQPPAAFFNVAFRPDEPHGPPAAADSLTDPAYWRDRLQGRALAARDITPFHATVDFGKLRAGATDESGVPRTGPLNRILASRFEPFQGFDETKACGKEECVGEFGSRLQPYAIYVPEERQQPPAGWGLTLLLHSLTSNHNQFSASANQRQFGERGAGHLVVTPLGRAYDGWYYDLAEADVFEVWADVARHYRLDAGRAAISGYSMGGYGTFRLGARFPDLFTRAFTGVGPPALGITPFPAPPLAGEQTSTTPMLESFRHIPLLMWVATEDELVPYSGTRNHAERLAQLGYVYGFSSFHAAEHVTLAVNDQFAPAAEFLGDGRVDPDPPRVSYVLNPAMDDPDHGLVADHAYWLSGMRTREAGFGRIDVRSEGHGVGEAEPAPVERGPGVLTGGAKAPLPFTQEGRAPADAPAAPVRDRLVVRAENVRTATVDVRRARVTCGAELDVRSDGPLDLRLTGCPLLAPAPPAARCASRRRFRIHTRKVRGARRARVTVDGRRVRAVRRRGRFTAVVDLRGKPRKTVLVRIVLVVRRDGVTRRLTGTRRYRTCRPGPRSK